MLLPSPVNVYKARGSNYAHGRSPADMIGKILLVLSTLALAGAQVPSLGFCPEYIPMPDFDLAKFMGVWYEAERYFQLTEVVSRCVMANYTLGADGKFHVSNEVTNRFTGIKRIVEGELKMGSSKTENGKLVVKYTIPLAPETKYSVLKTDYDTYAVLWSCSGIGPFHTQNAWIMTRERLAPNSALQEAYGVLDAYKISKSFFMKTDQEDCALLDKPPAAPQKGGSQEAGNKPQNVRSAIMPDASEVILEMNKAKEEMKEEAKKEEMAIPPVLEKKPMNTVPERIMEAAEAMKEGTPLDSAKISSEAQPSEAVKESSENVEPEQES